MLTADKTKCHPNEIQPKDLLIKSNPGLFADMHPDITNPRDMYNFLSKRKLPKLVDDMSFIRQKTVYDEKLTRSNSFKDLSKTSNAKMPKKYHFHSHQDLSILEKKDPSVIALNNNAPYISPEDMSKLPEREKTIMTNFNLPLLNENELTNGRGGANEGAINPVAFPVIQSANTDTVMKASQREHKVKTSKSQGSRTKSNVTFSNKIDKWFSEMPADVTDKADRAVMVDMIRDRMSVYQSNNRFDERLSKIKRRNVNLKSFNQIQHQYLELRAESTVKQRRNDTHLNNFQLNKQRTSLGLKTDVNDIERNRVHNNATEDNEEEFENEENKPSLVQLARSSMQNSNGLKKINLDKFAYDAYSLNPNRRFNFAQLENVQQNKFLDDIHADSIRRKSDREHWFRMSQVKTHPSIVNISIDKERNNSHRSNQLKQSLSVVKMDNNKESILNQHAHMDIYETKHNTSASSSLSSRGKKDKQSSKAAKFNTLDVFGGVRTLTSENTFYPETANHTNPLVKLDLRRARTQHRKEGNFDQTSSGVLPRKPQELATVDFRFGSGEVVITRKSSGGPVTSPDMAALKSPNAPPNNTEYSVVTDDISRDEHEPIEEMTEPKTFLSQKDDQLSEEDNDINAKTLVNNERNVHTIDISIDQSNKDNTVMESQDESANGGAEHR